MGYLFIKYIPAPMSLKLINGYTLYYLLFKTKIKPYNRLKFREYKIDCVNAI